MAQQGFEDTPLLTLEEIRTHHRQNQRDTLRLINTFLAHYPDDRVAQLLKVEICLAQKVSAAYPFVTRTLAQHFDDDDDLHTWADKLRRQRERLVRKSMKNGREYAGQKNLDDAIAAFEDAIALQPEDPGLYFAAGHALLSTFPEAAEGENRDSFFAGLFRRERLRESSLQRWHESVVAYLEGALRYAEAEDGLYQDAFAALARYCKAWNRVPAGFIAYWPEQADPALHDLRQLMVDHALDMAATLLRLHKPREASRLLNLARKVLPRHPALRLLLAEKHRQNERLDKAAIELGRAGGASDAPPDLDTEALSRLAAQLDKQQAPCPQCRKRSPLFDFTFKAPQRIHTHCPICGAALRVGDLWADAYDLTLADMPAAAYVARAELALHQDDIEAALPHLDDAEAALPPNHKGHLNIRMTRHNITQPQSGHTRQERLNAAIDRGVVDDSLLYFITQMNRQMPEGWADIPPQRRLKLCRMLLKGGHYLALQKLFPLAFADNPARKSVTQFAAQMDNTITTYVQAQREPAQKALRASRPEEAARLMTTVIELMPRLPELYLIRGEAHLQLQQDAPALDDFHHVLEYADDITLRDRAIKNIAVLLEQRWDLDGAQKMLGRVSTQDDETAQLYERIERRRAAMPYIRVKPADVTLAQDSVIATAGPPSHHALFAVAVREVSALHSPEAMNAVLSASFEFIQSLGNFRDVMHDVVFALRFIGWPYPEIPERGTIRVALLVRVTDGDAEVAQRRARRVYRDLLPSLPLSQDNIYVFEPVVDEAELDSLLMPFQSDDISQIVRRESTPEQDGIYAVAPFRVGTRDLHALMWTLLRQSAPAMVSLHLKPTHFYAWERQTHVSLPELPLRAEEGGGVGYLLDHAQATQQAIEGHSRQTEQFKTLENPFLLQINVWGAEGNSHFLPNLVAASLLATADNQQGAGGYAVVKASNHAEHVIAGRNLRDIDVEHWGYSNAPDESKHKMRYLVSEQEAATLFRLPIPAKRGVPGLPLLEGRPIAPPAGMSETGTPLGVSTARAANAMPIKVRISDADRRRHLYVVGKTGTGKSTLLANIVLHDIYAGKAVCLLDPHGDLVQDVLVRIPGYRKDDVILFDPSDQDYPIGLNILNPKDDDDKMRITNAFIGMLQRMYDPYNQGIVGPIFQSFVRNALIAVMSVPDSSLVDVYRILTTPAHIKKYLPHIQDPAAKGFWEEELDKSKNQSSWRQDVTIYLTSKFSSFVEDPVLRRNIGQNRNSIDWYDAIQSQKIILLNLAKGQIGAETSQFLGLLLISEILSATFLRGKLPHSQRHDFSIVIDEVQNYATPMLSTIIAEGRKFGLSLTLANQYIHQLDGGLREAVFGNVGTIGAMRVGIDDAAVLAREFYPIFSADDLSNLPRFTAAIKLLVNGMATRPFTMRTLMPTHAPDAALAAEIRGLSQMRYGTPIAQVEQEIMEKFDGVG